MANQTLLQVQIGKETTYGTPVAATAKLMGLLDYPEFQPVVEGEVYTEARGSMAPGFIALLNAYSATGKIPGYVTYEDDPYYMEALMGVVAPTGAGPYVYAEVAPLAALPVSPRIMTMEFGDKVASSANYRMSGGALTKFTYKGENKKPLTFDAEFIGTNIAAFATLTTLSDRVVEPVHGAQLTVAIDAWGGTMGATLITATALAFELSIDTKRKSGFYFNSLPPLDYDEDTWSTNLKLTLKFNTTSKAEIDAIIGATIAQRQIRLKATSGVKIWQKDFAGTYTKAPKFWDGRNGAIIAQLELDGTYNTALANYFKSSVTNSVATLA